MDTINSIIEFELIKIGNYSLTMGTLLTVLFAIIFTKIVLWLLKKIYSVGLYYISELIKCALLLKGHSHYSLDGFTQVEQILTLLNVISTAFHP